MAAGSRMRGKGQCGHFLEGWKGELRTMGPFALKPCGKRSILFLLPQGKAYL